MKQYKFILSESANANFCHSLISKFKENLNIKEHNFLKAKRIGNFILLTSNNEKLEAFLSRNKNFKLNYFENSLLKECECFLVEEKELKLLEVEDNEEILVLCDNFNYQLRLKKILDYLNISYEEEKVKNLKFSILKDNKIRNSIYVKELNLDLKNDERIVEYIKTKLSLLFKKKGLLLDLETLKLKQTEEDCFYTKGHKKRLFNTCSIEFKAKIKNKKLFFENACFSMGGKVSYGCGFLRYEKK